MAGHLRECGDVVNVESREKIGSRVVRSFLDFDSTACTGHQASDTIGPRGA